MTEAPYNQFRPDLFLEYDDIMSVAGDFASKDITRPAILKPVHHGTSIFATDGRIALEIDTGKTAEEARDEGYALCVRTPYDRPDFPIQSLLDLLSDSASMAEDGRLRPVTVPLARFMDAVRLALRDAMAYGRMFDIEDPDCAVRDAALAIPCPWKEGKKRYVFIAADAARKIAALASTGKDAEKSAAVTAYVPLDAEEPRCRHPLFFKGSGWRCALMPLRQPHFNETTGEYELCGSIAAVDKGTLIHSAKFD